MNKVIIIGNLTSEADVRTTATDIKVARFTLAVNRNYTNKDGEREADFLNCVAWRGLAEVVEKYGKKGKKLAVVGSLQNRSYEDNKGAKRTITEIVAEDIELLSPVEKQVDYDDAGDIPF